MSEYIKREDALTAVAGLLNVIEKMPSADVVEVVRCKDCKFNKAKDEDKGVCGLMVYVHNTDDYCSYGERKDERTIFIDETIDETCGYGEDGESE